MEDKEVRGTCETCKYSAEAHTGLECRVGAPAVDYKSGYRRFPVMLDSDWCSRFKVKIMADEEP